MAEFTPNIAAAVVEACRNGAGETAQALSRSLDGTFAVTVGDAGTFDPAALPDDFDGPGLAIVLIVGDVAALATIAESSGLLPEWYKHPDATGESKLTTLAQELGMLLLPEEFMPGDFKAGRVANLREAAARGGVVNGAGLVSLEISAGEKRGAMRLVWPATSPAAILQSTAEAASAEASADNPQPAESAPQRSSSDHVESPNAPMSPGQLEQIVPYIQSFEQGVDYLPPYSRSLLCIRVPVRVTLAEKKQPIDGILALGPGSMIQFDKACDEMLELEVGEQRIALGEAVKVGEKFGLRITSMILPGERFRPLGEDPRRDVG
jgi:flagellar motor switch/type III secretory pathway protein FliN